MVHFAGVARLRCGDNRFLQVLVFQCHPTKANMYEWFKFLHLSAGVVWLGGMALVILALRPVAMQLLAPPERVNLMYGVLARFFSMVWLSIALLLATGIWMLSVTDMKLAPKGWHAMSGLGLLMCLIFAHIWFAPFRRLKTAVAAADWSAASQALGQIQPMVLTNFALGWVAVLAVVVWR
jgi:uncharacterized membrane protein